MLQRFMISEQFSLVLLYHIFTILSTVFLYFYNLHCLSTMHPYLNTKLYHTLIIKIFDNTTAYREIPAARHAAAHIDLLPEHRINTHTDTALYMRLGYPDAEKWKRAESRFAAFGSMRDTSRNR